VPSSGAAILATGVVTSTKDDGAAASLNFDFHHDSVHGLTRAFSA
jgi:hypothetical protein